MTTGVDITNAGNSPQWDITVLVYLPHASVTWSGIINKGSYGYSCFVMVMDHILINGTAEMLEYGECVKAGLAMPQANVAGRGELVN